MATDSDSDSPVNLLALDGGGIRGVSELIILNQIMERLQYDLKLPHLPRPCDYFDIIGGTSTGGLIALMLGRLRLTTREALEQYSALAGKIFDKTNKKWVVQDGTFKASTLEQQMRRIVAAHSDGDSEAMMIDERLAGGVPGRMFVCAMPARNMAHARLFRSYKARENNAPNCHIWEAARATTAAPTFFKRIAIAEPGLISEEFIDAGIKCNNPAEILIKEAGQILDNDRPIGCIISIGTGQKGTVGMAKPDSFQKILPLSLIHMLKEIATDCEATANRLQEKFLNYPDIYFRFNVTHGVGSISLDEWTRMGEIQTHTTSYLSDPLVSNSIDTVVKILARKGKRLNLENPGADGGQNGGVTLGLVSGDYKIKAQHHRNHALQQEEDDREKIEKWLSPLDFLEKQQEIHGQACAGTGQWLLSRPEFQYWVRGNPWELRCYGDAGTGKTVLSSIIVEHLQKLKPASPVLYLYLEHSPVIPQTSQNLLGSLLKQIVQFRKPGISLGIRKAFEEAKARPSLDEIHLLLKAEIELYERVYLIVDALDEAEWEVRTNAQILDDETTFFGFSQQKLGVMITLREDEERSPNVIKCDHHGHRGEDEIMLYYSCRECKAENIQFDVCDSCKDLGATCVKEASHKLLLVGNVEVTIRPPTSDIELYVKSIIRKEMGEDSDEQKSVVDIVSRFNQAVLDTNTLERRKASDISLDGRTVPTDRYLSKLGEECRKDPELANEISAAIVQKADHNFRFARIYMNFLAEKMTLREIKQVLNSIPDKLKDDYEQALTERISDQDSQNKAKALKIISLVYSAYPQHLGLRELQHALAVEEGQATLDKELIMDEKGILKITKGLITIDRDMDAIVRLFHTSLREYLNVTRMRWFPDAESDIAQICLSYLNLDVFAQPCPNIEDFQARAKDYPFISYASRFWGDHVRTAGGDTEKIALAYLRQPGRIAAYIQAAWYNNLGAGDSWDVRRDVNALHVCAWFGLSSLIEALEPDNVDVVEQTYGQTPLIYACRRGHLETVETLLDLGANFNTRSSKGQTPLFEAIAHTKLIIAKSLLAHNDLSINEINPKRLNRSALILATRKENAEIVQAILERPDVSINQTDSKGYNALSLAAHRGNEAIVKMIIAKPKVDLNAREYSGGRTALILAAEQNQSATVELLLQHNADALLKDMQGRTAAMRAAEEGSMAVLRVILNLDVALTQVDEDGRTLLHGASANRDASIVSLLGSHGLDANARDHNGLTPLHEACQNGHLDAVEALLKLSADSSLKDEFDRTPFTVAWQYGQNDIMDVLIAKGSNRDIDSVQDVHAEQLPGWSLVRLGHIDLIRAGLVAKTLDLTIREPCTNCTAIHCAVIANDMDVLKLLLEQTSLSSDALDRNEYSALFFAAAQDNAAAAQLLLAYSTQSLDVANRWGETPLSIACSASNYDVAMALIQAGAAVDVATIYLQPLLLAAVEHDNVEVVETLLGTGADILGQDEKRRTALQVAKMEVADEVLVKVLAQGKSFYVRQTKKGDVARDRSHSAAALMGMVVDWFWKKE